MLLVFKYPNVEQWTANPFWGKKRLSCYRNVGILASRGIIVQRALFVCKDQRFRLGRRFDNWFRIWTVCWLGSFFGSGGYCHWSAESLSLELRLIMVCGWQSQPRGNSNLRRDDAGWPLRSTLHSPCRKIGLACSAQWCTCCSCSLKVCVIIGFTGQPEFTAACPNPTRWACTLGWVGFGSLHFESKFVQTQPTTQRVTGWFGSARPITTLSACSCKW